MKTKKSKKVLLCVLAAVCLCCILAALLWASTNQKESRSLPAKSYAVREVIYQDPVYSFSMVAGQNTPYYTVQEDMQLLSRGELTDEDEWISLGTLTAWEPTESNFDTLFRNDTGTGWATDDTPASLRKNTIAAWRLLYENKTLYHILKQKNGTLYLAYGYNGENAGDTASAGGSSIRWLYLLTDDTVEAAVGASVDGTDTVAVGDADAPVDSADGKTIRVFTYDGGDTIHTSSVTLYSDGEFQFIFSPISSYIGIGTYAKANNRLTLRTDDGEYTYVFTLADDTLVFDAAASSSQLWYSELADGAIFR